MSGYIKGQFRKSIFTTDNGYIIGIFKVVETDIEDVEVYINRTITFTGYFHELNEIDTYKLIGKLVQHPRYGEQFQVDQYERCRPETKDAITSFLSSGIFKGIGEVKAKKIAHALGKDTFNIILETPNNLLLIPTITKKNIEELHQKLKEYESSYETIIYLNNLGFNTKDSMLIYNRYHELTIKQIDEDIYQLIEDIYEMTYKKIDYIAMKLGIEKNHIIRVKATILYVMRELSNTFGHSYYNEEEIYSYLLRVLKIKIDRDFYQEALNQLEKGLKIIVKNNRYYLALMYEAEENIVKRFRLLSHSKDNEHKEIDEMMRQIEQKEQIQYNENQKEAIKKSFIKQLLLITGGPGTGKTTIMKAIVELYRLVNQYSKQQMEEKIALLAPTGRAAKKMAEKTGYSSSTIHRFLKWNKENDTFQINEYNKSKVEFVLIDEASMIDTYLFHHLLKGLSIHTKMIIVGDYDQLPSVGPGQVLHDLISSNCLEVVYLKQLYRQGKDSNILTLAYDIKNNMLSKEIFNQSEDLTFIECPTNKVQNYIQEIADTYKNLSYKDFQILAPMYKTLNGIDHINQKVQEIFNPKSNHQNEILVGDTIYKENDKVIQLSNMPDENVYNGDIGIIKKIVNKKNREIHIDYDGNLIKYTPSKFNQFKLAYSISIHKSQGSEFQVVVIPIVPEFKKMLYKKLIYTAITRSREKLYLIGNFQSLEYAVGNTKSDLRRTSIEEFLKNGIN